MNEIDWSKAPEWATKHGISGAFKSPVWFDDKKYTYVDGQQGGKEFFYADACTYAAKDFSQVSERPTTPSWSGEGLPPVGVVCEYQRSDVSYRQTWVKVTVKYISLSLVVLEHFAGKNEFVESRDSCVFRPIRTPEQIAADARDAAAVELYDLISGPGDNMAAAKRVYDAGYRRP